MSSFASVRKHFDRGNSQIGAKDIDAIENITVSQLNYAGHHWRRWRTLNGKFKLTLTEVIRTRLAAQGEWTWKLKRLVSLMHEDGALGELVFESVSFWQRNIL